MLSSGVYDYMIGIPQKKLVAEISQHYQYHSGVANELSKASISMQALFPIS
jgi:hypothetical protein